MNTHVTCSQSGPRRFQFGGDIGRNATSNSVDDPEESVMKFITEDVIVHFLEKSPRHGLLVLNICRD